MLSDWNYLWVNGVKCATKDIALPPSALLKQDILGSGDYFVPPTQELVIHIPDNVGRVKLVTNLSNLIVEVDNIGVQQ